MTLPYFMDGRAQMKKVKEEKELQKEMIKMTSGRFICGLDGCEIEVSNKHQAKHAMDEHTMGLREYKDARLAMKKGNYTKKSDEQFKPELKERIETARAKIPVLINQIDEEIESMDTVETPQTNSLTTTNTTTKEKAEEVAEEHLYEDERDVSEDLSELTPEEQDYSMENKNTTINKESLTILLKKEQLDKLIEDTMFNNATPKKILSSDNKNIPKDIIEITQYECPHCGGKLKMKETFK